MLIEIMTLTAILLLLNRRRADAGDCAVYGQPGYYFTWEELTTTRLPFANNPSGPQCTNLKRLEFGRCRISFAILGLRLIVRQG